MRGLTPHIINGVVSGLVGALVAVATQNLIDSGREESLATEHLAAGDNRPETTIEPRVATEPFDEPPVRSEEWGVEQEGPGWVVYRRTVPAGGAELALEALVLTQEHRWRYGKADAVVDPAGNAVVFRDYLADRGLLARVERAHDLVSFGMASCEGTLGAQEDLAGRRAEMLATWLRNICADGHPRNFYKANLGQYRKVDCRREIPSQEDTSPQRRVVIVYTSRDRRPRNLSRAELEEHIEQALRVGRNLLFDPADYSLPFALAGS